MPAGVETNQIQVPALPHTPSRDRGPPTGSAWLKAARVLKSTLVPVLVVVQSCWNLILQGFNDRPPSNRLPASATRIFHHRPLSHMRSGHLLQQRDTPSSCPHFLLLSSSRLPACPCPALWPLNRSAPWLRLIHRLRTSERHDHDTLSGQTLPPRQRPSWTRPYHHSPRARL